MRIGCIASNEISYNRQVARGVIHFAKCHEDVVVDILNPRDIDAETLFRPRRYDGLLFATYTDYTDRVIRHRIPAISLSNDRPRLTMPRVVTDDHQVGCMVAEHLLSKGHRHLAFLGGLEYFSQCRYEGFLRAIVQALGPEAAPVHLHPMARHLANRLKRLPKPLGLMAGNDNWGAMATAICRQSGLRVPEDVSVIGVDDDDLLGEMANPPLSTIVQLTDRISFTAGELLLQLIAGKSIPQLTLIPPGPLVLRQSSQAIAVEDELVAHAIALMEQQLGRSVNVNQLLDQLNVSRRSFELRFMKAMNRTPGQELLRLKIERAKNLLATTRQPIAQIAALVGFTTPTRLSIAFRRAAGMTPSDYRERFAMR